MSSTTFTFPQNFRSRMAGSQASRGLTRVSIKADKGTASKKKKAAKKTPKAIIRDLSSASSLRSSIVLLPSATPFPNIWRGNLEYTGRIFLSQTSGSAPKSFNMRPNCLFDCDSANNLGNIQPFGFDQLFGASLYTSYAVKKTKMKITVTHATYVDQVTSAKTYPNLVGSLDIVIPKVVIGGQSSTVDADTEALAQPGTERRSLMKYGDSTTFYRTYDIDSIFEKNSQSNSNNIGTNTTNPNTTISQYFHIGDQNEAMLGALQYIGYYVDIAIVFTIEAYNGNYPQS